MIVPSPVFHSPQPSVCAGRTKSRVVELVEIPLVQQELVERRGHRAGELAGQRRARHVEQIGERDAERRRRPAAPASPRTAPRARAAARRCAAGRGSTPPQNCCHVARRRTIVVAQIAGEHRADRQHHQRHQHHPRALVHMLHRLVVGARLAVEGHDQQAPGVERGQEGREDAEPEGVACRRRYARAKAASRIDVLGVEAGEERECRPAPGCRSTSPRR